MQPAFVGIDVAFAKKKRLPLVLCTRDGSQLKPAPLRRLDIKPPLGLGNAASINPEKVERFADETADYLTQVCQQLGVKPVRIAIDAPSAPRSDLISRRAAETAMDGAQISCFTTPSASDFDTIRAKVAHHLAIGGKSRNIPHANQLWMLAGFALFQRLKSIAPCIEVFPQATVRALKAGAVHKSKPGAVDSQLAAAGSTRGGPPRRTSSTAFRRLPGRDGTIAWTHIWQPGSPPSRRRTGSRSECRLMM